MSVRRNHAKRGNQRRRQGQRPRRDRRGAVVVEGAVIVSVLFLLLFYTLDVGLAVVRYNMLSAAARAVARQATMRGTMSAPENASWGPTQLSFNAADGREAATVARPHLATLNPADVTISVTWPDGDNEPRSRVRVVLTFAHSPSVPMLSLGSSLQLQAACTMRIVH